MGGVERNFNKAAPSGAYMNGGTSNHNGQFRPTAVKSPGNAANVMSKAMEPLDSAPRSKSSHTGMGSISGKVPMTKMQGKGPITKVPGKAPITKVPSTAAKEPPAL